VRAAIRLACAWATLPKASSSVKENEDAIAAVPPRGRFAVSDGASESWQSGPWARHLAGAYVKHPPTPAEFPRWLAAVRKAWTPPETTSSAWYADVKKEQGSFATLLGIHFETRKAKTALAWKAMAIGDSCLFVVRDGAIKTAFPIESAAAFGNQPALVPSKTDQVCPEPEWLAGTAEPGNLFLLASDAAAAGVFRKAGPDFWQLVQKALDDETASGRAHGLVELAREFQSVQNDDVSIVAAAIATTIAPEEK
jgi:hypothetical protein